MCNYQSKNSVSSYLIKFNLVIISLFLSVFCSLCLYMRYIGGTVSFIYCLRFSSVYAFTRTKFYCWQYLLFRCLQRGLQLQFRHLTHLSVPVGIRLLSYKWIIVITYNLVTQYILVTQWCTCMRCFLTWCSDASAYRRGVFLTAIYPLSAWRWSCVPMCLLARKEWGLKLSNLGSVCVQR